MDDAFLVRRIERVRDLLGDGQRLLDREWSFGDPLGKSVALDELEHEAADVTALFDAVNCRDVRMIQRREYPRFAIETGEPIGIAAEYGREDLDRDVALSLVSRAR